MRSPALATSKNGTWAGPPTCQMGTFFQIPLALTMPISNNFSQSSEAPLKLEIVPKGDFKKVPILQVGWSAPPIFSMQTAEASGKYLRDSVCAHEDQVLTILRTGCGNQITTLYSIRNRLAGWRFDCRNLYIIFLQYLHNLLLNYIIKTKPILTSEDILKP